MKRIKKLVCAVLAAVLMLCAVPVSASALYYSYNGEVQQFSKETEPRVWSWLEGSNVVISPDYMENADGFRIYRYDPEVKKYTLLGELTGRDDRFVDSDIQSFTTYKYVVKAFRKSGKKYMFSKGGKTEVTTYLMQPEVSYDISGKKLTVCVEKDPLIEGYEIYTCKHKKKSNLKDYIVSGYWGWTEFTHPDHGGDCMELAKTLKKKTSYTMKYSTKYNYFIYVRAYGTYDGETYYSTTDMYSTIYPESYLSTTSDKPINTIKMVSYRDDMTDWSFEITKEDRQIMKAFAKKHFTEGMTKYEKLQYVAEYIHNNVDYAYDYSAIGSSSYVEAVFKKNVGQCVQYNGAMAAFAAYLGCEVRMVQGMRGRYGDSWSHYWAEININGYWYLLEAGNKKDGLYYFIQPYEMSEGYLCNGSALTATKKVK